MIPDQVRDKPFGEVAALRRIMLRHRIDAATGCFVFFYLSKIIWFFAGPTNFLVALGVIGAGLLFTPWKRLGRAVVSVAALGLLVLGFSPISKLLARPLEDRFPQQQIDARPVDAIIVLGGAIGFGRGQVAFNEAASRMSSAVELAKQHPKARLVFTGGDAALIDNDAQTEANAAAAFFLTAGIEADRILLESRSRNTRENAVFTRQLMRPEAGARWLLVTSAFHMPRAIGCFRAVGIEAEAFPVDYRTDGDRRDFVMPFRHMFNGMQLADLAVKEWVGLLVYRMAGYTSELLPGPRAPGAASGNPIR
jgi:uncharacterized SAM-binding protein YcdF (DUF218 family)